MEGVTVRTILERQLEVMRGPAKKTKKEKAIRSVQSVAEELEKEPVAKPTESVPPEASVEAKASTKVAQIDSDCDSSSSGVDSYSEYLFKKRSPKLATYKFPDEKRAKAVEAAELRQALAESSRTTIPDASTNVTTSGGDAAVPSATAADNNDTNVPAVDETTGCSPSPSESSKPKSRGKGKGKRAARK
ncbi:hypothetical protein FOZ61_000798 [Perkinsus olseni]|nr:hypothetical protein FOZ61_000798 [Perkinsus olseni]